MKTMESKILPVPKINAIIGGEGIGRVAGSML